MMRLLCDGVALDLYDNANLQFKKSNPAFAFGEMSSERTTQFKLPCTPTNDKVLGLARIPAYDGGEMRKKFTAQLQCGSVVKNGFLYVSDFDGKDYTAILVAGLAYDIKAFDNYGWGSIILPELENTLYDADAASIPVVSYVKYHADHNDGQCQPSIDLSKLFALMKAQGVFDITGYTSQQIRLIRNSRNALDRVKDILTNTPDSPEDLTLSTANKVITLGYLNLSQTQLTGFHYETDCEITFAENTPANLCICYAKQSGTDLVGFIGDRYFEESGGNVVYRGEPLAGRTIQLPSEINGEPVSEFVLIDAGGADMIGGVPYFAAGNGGHMDYVPAYSVEVRVTADVWAETASAMLADLNLGELLKAYSALTGKLINAKANGAVQFIDALNADVMELDIIASKDVKRTFSDYARSNSVKYAKNDLIPEEQQGVAYYTIDNDNIEESKDLLTLKFDQGGLYGDGTDNLLEVLGVTTDGEFSTGVLKTEALALAGGNVWMHRTSLTKSNLLQTLCDKSTQLVVDARMILAKFSDIDSATCLLVRGTKYTWVEASWQKDVASITLQKIQ